MAITDKELAAANARGRKMLRTTPRALAVRYDEGRDRIVVELSTGAEIAFAPRDAQGLEAATPEALAEIAIDPPGFGLHFPKLDVDLYLPTLLEGLLRGAKALGRVPHGASRRRGAHPREASSLARQRPARRPAPEGGVVQRRRSAWRTCKLTSRPVLRIRRSLAASFGGCT